MSIETKTATHIRPVAGRRHWSWRLAHWHWSVAFLLYAGIVALLSGPLLLRLSSWSIGPSGGDNLWYAWSMWEFRRSMETGQDPAHTHLIFALLPSVQIFVDGFFNEALSWPLQWVMSPLTAYNVAILVSFVISGLTMYALASHFVSSRAGCFVAGFLYTFSTYHFARAAGHLGLLTMQWLPLCAWRISAFYRRPNATNAALAGLGLALVPLSEIYYLPYFALPFVGVFAVDVILHDRAWISNRRNLLLVGLATLIAAAISIPPLGGYLRVDADVAATARYVAQSSTEMQSADLLAFLLPSDANPIFGSATAPIYRQMISPFLPVEGAVFLGYPAMLLALIALLYRQSRNRAALFWALLGAVGFVLALGPRLYVAGHGLFPLPTYQLVFGWPFLSTFRAPNRLGILPLMSVSVLSAYGVEVIVSRFAVGFFSKIALSVAGVMLLGLSLLQHVLWSVALPSSPVPISPLYQEIGADKDRSLLLDLPLVVSGLWQYYQTIHHKLLVYGYAPRTSPRMLTSVENIPYLSQFDPVSSTVGGTPEVSQGDIYPVSTGFKQGLEDKRIKYVVLHNAVDANTFAWMRRFLEGNLGHPFYDNADEGLVAWRIPSSRSHATYRYQWELGSGWILGLGSYNHRLLRAIEQDGQFIVRSRSTARPALSFRALSYNRPLTMIVYLNGIAIKTVQLGQPGTSTVIDVGRVNIQRGKNLIAIHAVEGCSRPHDLNPTNMDTRCLTFGIQDVRLQGY